jgi:hypothetical protein
MDIKLKKVRLAFPALDAPKGMSGATSDEDDKAAYGARLIIEPKSENAQILRDAMAAAATQKWEGKGSAVLKQLIADRKVCFVTSEYRNQKTGEPYTGFEGMWHVGARNSLQPSVYDRSGEVVPQVDIARVFYSGCYVHAMLSVYAQDNKWGRRINASLLGVRFAGHGEAFGGARVARASDFSDIVDDADTDGENLESLV